MRVATLLLTAILVLAPASVALAQSEPAPDSEFSECLKLFNDAANLVAPVTNHALTIYERSSQLIDYKEYTAARTAVRLFWTSIIVMHMRGCKAPPLDLIHTLGELHAYTALYSHVRAGVSIAGSGRDKADADRVYLGSYLDGLLAGLQALEAQLDVVRAYYENNAPNREIEEVHGDPANPCDVAQGQVHYWSRVDNNTEVLEWYDISIEEGCNVDGWYVPPTLDCAVLDQRVSSSIMAGQGAAAANWRTVRMGAGC